MRRLSTQVDQARRGKAALGLTHKQRLSVRVVDAAIEHAGGSGTPREGGTGVDRHAAIEHASGQHTSGD